MCEASMAGVVIVEAEDAPLLVEEKPVCGEAIGGLLAGACGVAACRLAHSAAEALAEAAARPPRLLAVDLFTINYRLHDLRRLVEAAAPAPVLVIGDRPGRALTRMARLAGARGYVAKSMSGGELRGAAEALLAGGSAFPEPPEASAGLQAGRLSGRQMEVLREIARGRTNREIAEALGITTGTVKLHINAILRLTGARNRTEAALIAGAVPQGEALP